MLSEQMQWELLARRAMACKHWRWMPGMQLQTKNKSHRVIAVGNQGIRLDSGWASVNDMNNFATPDLTDPATLGCLLALVREVRNDAGFHALLLHIQENPIDSERDSRWWGLRGVDVFYSGHSWPSESAALVAALEAAP